MIQANKIEIEYDDNASETDKYGRPLVWVWVDDSLIQEELISKGLARTYMLQYNYKYAWILQENEEKAQEEKIGVWSGKETTGNITVESPENTNLDFVGLIIIIIVLIVATLFGEIKKRNKK